MESITCKGSTQNKFLSISLPGDVLSTNAEAFRKQIFSALDPAGPSAFPIEQLEMDLARANMVDSVGLNLLVSVMKTMKARSASVRFIIGSRSVERTFQFTRLNLQAEVVRTQDLQA